MNLLRLLLALFLFLVVRRWWTSLGRSRRSSRPEPGVRTPNEGTGRDPDYDELTDQGIDDADFEEIP